MVRRAWLPALLLLLVACGERELFAPDDVGVLVVDAVLVAGRELPEIRLTRTLAPDAVWNPFIAGVEGAIVEITCEDGAIWRFVGAPGRPGVYQPPGSAPVVESATRYDLSVELGEERLTASTLVPEPFERVDYLLLDLSGNTVLDTLATYAEAGDSVYSRASNRLPYDSGLFEARFPRPDAAGFQVVLRSLDPGSDFVIDPDFFEPEDFEELERINSSPAFLAERGTLRLPWFAIFFEGRYRLDLFAVDRNWFDYVRSRPDEGGGFGFGGNAGEGFDRPIFHVQGGIGLFGSAVVDSAGFTVLPPNP